MRDTSIRSRCEGGREARLHGVPAALAFVVCVAFAGTARGAEVRSEQPAAPSGTPAAAGPAASLGALPARDLRLTRAGLSFLEGVPPGTTRNDPATPVAVAARPALLPRFAPAGVGLGLISRMEGEAQRYRNGHAYDLAAAPDPLDSVGQALRAEEAERIMTRAFNRTLDSRLDILARSSDRLAAALSRVEDFGASFRSRSGRSGRDLLAAAATVQPPLGKDAHASVGLRLGAHPAFVVRGGFLGFRGRVDLPLLGEPLRLSLERPLGPRGSAALTAGADRDGHDWAALALGFSF
jgi:hypothetical protein